MTGDFKDNGEMKNIASALAPAALAAILSGCAVQENQMTVTENVINPGYLGNGIEWDPYDEVKSWGGNISEEDWAMIFSRLDYMKPQYVRCMINSPFTYFNSKTGKYERDRNKEYITRLLSYCQENGIMVIYGEYNPPTWEMKDSQEWVEMSVNYLNHLVDDLGFSCIRHFIIFNEPDGNWASTNGDYKLWESMAERFLKEMSRYPGLADVDLAGPDAVMDYRNPASEFGTEGWIAQSAADLDSHIGIYDIHAYPGQHYVRSGEFAEELKKLRKAVPEGKKILFGEAGYKYGSPEDSLLMDEYKRRVEGHPFTKGSDCNMLVYDYFYALDMPLFAMEAMNNGFSGAAAWMLDDAMHSNGDSGKTEDIKIWGMWNTVGSEVFGDPSQEELRPWYYTWSMMCRYFPAGTDILDIAREKTEGIHCVAGKKDGRYSIAILNISDSDFNTEVSFPGKLQDASVFCYREEDAANTETCPEPVETGIRTRKIKEPLG